MKESAVFGKALARGFIQMDKTAAAFGGLRKTLRRASYNPNNGAISRAASKWGANTLAPKGRAAFSKRVTGFGLDTATAVGVGLTAGALAQLAAAKREENPPAK